MAPPILEQIEGIKRRRRSEDDTDPFALMEEELAEALTLYWGTAARIMEGSGIHLIPPEADAFGLGKQFFSALFLYSYHRAGISAPRRILYTAANQCLRGIVSGCDNLLDDEYRKTLDTDLPSRAKRFRSIMDIMVSDRVLFEILFNRYRKGDYTAAQLLAASAALFRALARSGVPAAAEEGGVSEVLPPARVLEAVHHFKTGLLFQAPWALPLILEDMAAETVSHLLSALYRIGIGCQVMDDMVDLDDDLRNGRHNYMASLIYHDFGEASWSRLQRMTGSIQSDRTAASLLESFPEACSQASQLVRESLAEGLKTLFLQDHHHLVESAVRFLARRIGAEAIVCGEA